MIPKLLCGSCGNELSPQDKFCSNCGARVTPEGASEEPKPSATVNCKLCGSENPVGTKYCSVCGAVLAGGTSEPRHRETPRDERKSGESRGRGSAEQKVEKRRSQGARGLSQGKIIVVFGGLLIIGVIIIGITRNQTKSVPAGSATENAVSPTLMQDIERLRETVNSDSTNAAAILRLANLLHDGKFMDQARLYYKKYLTLNTKNPTKLLQFANLLHDKRIYDLAIASYETYLSQDSKNPDARVDLGICYFESGDKDRAIAEMKKALTYAPKHQLALFNLGIVNLSSGNLDEATQWFRKCIDAAPGTETARRAQELISQHTGSSPLKLN
jgi:tetratricopeptide (TPR) repeat protein